MLTVNNAEGGKTTFPVPAGMEIHFYLPALHYNRMSSSFCLEDWSLLKSHSEILEGPPHLSATEVP